MLLFDTHCHLDLPNFDSDREHVLIAARNNGVDKIVVPATTQNRWPNLINICNAHETLYPALGLHPYYLDQHQKDDVASLEGQIKETSVVAVGEIGLDYYLKSLDRSRQLELFEAQLSVAKNAKLPAILHCRKAYDDLIKRLSKFKLRGGVAHAFNGSLQQANQLIDLGFKLGFGGMLTFERSNKLRRLATILPLSSIVLETDSPDLTVSQHKGERNSPAYLPYILDALAQVRNESKQDIAEQVYKNSLQVFAI